MIKFPYVCSNRAMHDLLFHGREYFQRKCAEDRAEQKKTKKCAMWKRCAKHPRCLLEPHGGCFKPLEGV